MALEVFRFQAEYCASYNEFLRLLGISPESVASVEQIPFLPIQLFKSHQIMMEGRTAELTFESSGTTGSQTSKHLVADAELYKQNLLRGFRHAYGEASDYCFLALLPSYLERGNSSLVYMVNELMKSSGHKHNGFFLDDYGSLNESLKQLESKGQQTILIGVSFALLDFAARFPKNLKHTTIMETGGMKGRRKELIREELHSILAEGFGVTEVHSEYGMTELLSQAYSKGNELFQTSPTMQILIRDAYNPRQMLDIGETGLINVIDLANVFSCSFIATDDVGRISNNGFEVLGRMDNSEVRGCNLMFN